MGSAQFDALIWAFSHPDNLTDCISRLQSKRIYSDLDSTAGTENR